MNAEHPPEHEITDYVCGELPADRRMQVEARLAADPRQAAEAMKLLAALHSLEDAQPAAAEPSADAIDQAAAWACDDCVDRAAVEQALSQNPPAAAEAFRMRVAWRSLQAEPCEISEDFTQRLRARLMREQQATVAAADAPRAVRHQPTLRWSRPRSAASALAACLCLALLGWWMLIDEKPAAASYSLADLPARLQQVTSLHVRGRVYKRVGGPDDSSMESQPVEWYVERPGRYWRRTDAFQGPGYIASDGITYIAVDHANRTATMGDEIAIKPRLDVELSLQGDLRRRLGGDAIAESRHIRDELVNGVSTYVYEQVREYGPGHRARIILWFNPATGLPVRVQQYFENADQPPFLQGELDYIAPNAAAPPGAFSFEAPPEYSLRQQDRRPRDVHLAAVAHGEARADVRLAVNLDGRAVLLYWACDDPSAPAGADAPSPWTLRLAATGADSPAMSHHHLRSDDDGEGRRWHWSLLLPEHGAIDAGSSYMFSFQRGRQRLMIALPLLRFDDLSLQQCITALHQLTTMDDPSPPPTLEEIRALLSEGEQWLQ